MVRASWDDQGLSTPRARGQNRQNLFRQHLDPKDRNGRAVGGVATGVDAVVVVMPFTSVYVFKLEFKLFRKFKNVRRSRWQTTRRRTATRDRLVGCCDCDA